MGENTKIEWSDHTFNPWIGCTKISPGCDHCYAEAMMDHRYHKVEWGGDRKRTSEAIWKQPLRWNRVARENNRRARVFCASLADWLDNQVPGQWRLDLAALIFQTPQLDWLLLTKRIENYVKLAPWYAAPPNVWLGVTAEDQDHYHRRWERLAQIRAAVRFISYEPALGPLRPSAAKVAYRHRFPDWIICGGESGHGARQMDPQWPRDLHEQCQRVGIAFFMKQMTGKAPIPRDLLVRQFPERVR